MRSLNEQLGDGERYWSVHDSSDLENCGHFGGHYVAVGHISTEPNSPAVRYAPTAPVYGTLWYDEENGHSQTIRVSVGG